MAPSGPAASALTWSLINPSRRVSVMTFSSRKRLRPFCVPTQTFCSRSSSTHHTKSCDSPSECENVSIFASCEAAGIRASPCPSVPIQVFPLLSRLTVWTLSVFADIDLREAVLRIARIKTYDAVVGARPDGAITLLEESGHEGSRQGYCRTD